MNHAAEWVTRGEAPVNGTRLSYEVAGAGEPLVLIHGFALDMRMWDDQFAVFARTHRVVRYDLRGFGTSALPDGTPYSDADDLAALLRHLEIVGAALLGLSAGGAVAIDVALAYPDMTRALIPVDAALGGHRWSDAWGAQLRSVWRAGREAGIDAARERWLALPLFAPACAQPAVAARLRRMVADYSGWHWVHRDPQTGSGPPAIDWLAEVSAPTLVVIGERDVPDFHAIADRLADQIEGARKVVLPRVGHMANMEAPAAFNERVLDFLT